MIAKNRIFLLPYFLMIFVSLTLPSDGEHGVLSPKSLSFIFANVFAMGYLFFRQKMTLSQIKLMGFMSLSVILLIGWMLISIIRDETTPEARLDQFKLFFITITFPMLTLYLISEKILTIPMFIRTILYSSMAYILAKVTLVALHLLGFVDIWSLMQSTGILFMRMSIFGNLDRVQTSVDISTPFLVFFILQSSSLKLNLSRLFKSSYLILSLLSTFLSFSRYLIFVYFISCFLYWLSLNGKGIFLGFLCLLVFSTGAYFAIGPENVHTIIERRLFSEENTSSDETRALQANALLDKFEKTPFIGTGIGGYAPEVIREPNVLHLYEVQWLAFLMQFGVIGLTFLLLPLIWIAFKLVSGSFSRVKWSFLGLFLLWILSGFTNPFLISLASGVMYTLFYICGEVLTPPPSNTIVKKPSLRYP